MKTKVDAPSPELARAVASYGERVGKEVEAKVAEVGRIRDITAAELGPAWRPLEGKPLGDDDAMRSLLERIAPINARAIDSLENEAEALQGVTRSFLGLAEALSMQRSGRITQGTARRLEASQKGVLWRIGQIARALEAAGDCDAVKVFPRAQLEAIEAAAKARIEQIHTVAASRCRRTTNEWVRPDQVKRPEDAASMIGERLGDPGLGASLLALHARLKGEARRSFAANLTGAALLADEAVNAPDYARTRMGWHHPNARSAYRRREHDAISRFQSQDRQDATQAALARDLQAVLRDADPARALDGFLVSSFLREIGVPPKSSAPWKPTSAAIRRALEHEAFVPLRALNETAREMSPDRALTPKVVKAVANITQHVVEGDYRKWRYDNPISAAQLSGLSRKQKRTFESDLKTTYRAGDVELKTREEDDIELLWLTKIGGPSHGFDYGGRCLLPLLSNGRTKAILVDDPRWPHNAAARSYLRVLHLEDGTPTLYLEPFQRDFPHRDAFGEGELDAHLYAAVIAHAKKKAEAMGLPLSIGAGYRDLVEALDVPVVLVEKPLTLKASNGVFEASDTLGLGHDFPQPHDLVTPPLVRLEFTPGR